MAEVQGRARKWRMTFVYMGLVMAILYVQLLPLQTMPRGWAGPDFVVLLTVAWAVRRPEFTPALSVAFITLVADFILLRPPGVMAAVMVGARHILKRQEPGLRDSTFMVEWVTVSVVLAGILLTNRIILAVFLVDQTSLGLSLMQLAMNVIFFPLVALASRFVLGVRKIGPGETDAMAGVT
ncbi:rod shape-determining protein MreD [Shimia gijangensis]|uniref:Rod shape-determining protein MreD n=1 Tax=Shimia gijangensis TaxID=1470563 RepID=A0A1M6FUP3_9RHOB|nr:hypothetical protein [Shimia gijangensis]SHJ01394.1 rod shape-determining protein MreD [Shimia gijangensis]